MLPSPARGGVPDDGDPMAPSLMRATATGRGADLTETESCAGCHADAAAAWRTSAHAFASFQNPIYRASVDRFRRVAGARASRFCGGCHDVALMDDGALDAEVAPDDPRAHGGITCRACHGIARTHADGDASYDLDLSPIPIPKDGDPESVARHKARVAPPPLRSPSLCASCHRVFLDEGTGNAHHLAGQDDATPWSRSAFAGSLAERVDEPIAERDCRGCHMPREEAKLGDAAATPAKGGTIASHRFLGGHTWLAAMRGDGETRARVERLLEGAATIDVAAVAADGAPQVFADGAAIAPGARVVVDVTARSVAVGHRFPGGVLDAVDTWIEVTVDTAGGARVADAGVSHATVEDDPTAHVLRATLVDADGRPVVARETDRFRAVAANQTLAPRDAAVVRYAFDAPTGKGAYPLKITARLRHRSRGLALQRFVCAESKTERGRAFRAAAAARVGVDLDPCMVQPITELSKSVAWIGPGSDARAADAIHPAPPWRRIFDHGLGLSRALQEYVGDARAPLERALAAATTDRERAMALAALGRVAARQGLAAEAASWADRADALLPGHPAIRHLRGESLAAVWRWDEAAAHLAEASRAAPHDTSLLAELAVAFNAAGRPEGALAAAHRGLADSPRDDALLFAQSIALSQLAAPDAAAAEEAYLHHRPADDVPPIKGKCSARTPGCALERVPVHVHVMRAAASASPLR